jgi:hypothetical protein
MGADDDLRRPRQIIGRRTHLAGKVFNVINRQNSKPYCISVVPGRRIITHTPQQAVPEGFEFLKTPSRLLFTVEAFVAKRQSPLSMFFPVTGVAYWVYDTSLLNFDGFCSLACQIVEGLNFNNMTEVATNATFLDKLCNSKSLIYDWTPGITTWSFRRFSYLLILDHQHDEFDEVLSQLKHSG